MFEHNDLCEQKLWNHSFQQIILTLFNIWVPKFAENLEHFNEENSSQYEDSFENPV